MEQTGSGQCKPDKREAVQRYAELVYGYMPDLSRCVPASTAVVCVAGERENWRMKEAVKLIPGKANSLWVTKVGDHQPPLSMTHLCRYYPGDISQLAGVDIRFGGYGEHVNSLSQAIWVSIQLRRCPSINSLIIVTAAYHLPRWLLTLVSVLDLYTLSPRVIPYPVRRAVPTYSIGSIRWNREIKKIRKYQPKGHTTSVVKGLAAISVKE